MRDIASPKRGYNSNIIRSHNHSGIHVFDQLDGAMDTFQRSTENISNQSIMNQSYNLGKPREKKAKSIL